MRLVVFGAGAIGGAIGARLHQSGHPVTLIARAAHGRAIRQRGLSFETPEGATTLELPVVERPDQLDWAGDEVVLLCMKTQDTAEALQALRASAPATTAVVCAQNGVENERLALRLFEHVYGAVVMLPAVHLEPGVVLAHGGRLTGMIDVGRYPEGIDERAAALVQALRGARFLSEAREDVMRLKYAKLIMNLANAPTALCRPGPDCDELVELAKAEGRAVLSAAGVEFEDAQVSDRGGRWAELGVGEIRGRPYPGSSTWQSLTRGTGGIETDYLNGEIVLLGRLHGVPAPVNEALCRLAEQHVRERRAPATVPAEEVLPTWTR